MAEKVKQNIRGGLAFFQNIGGLNLKSSPMAIPDQDAREATNVTLSITGAIERRRGSADYHAGFGGRWQGLFRIARSDGYRAVLGFCDGTLYEEIGGIFTPILAGLSATAVWDGIQYRDRLWLTNGVDDPLVCSGGGVVETMVSAGAVFPASWVSGNFPKHFSLTAYGRTERIAAYGFDLEPSIVWFSGIRDPLDYDEDPGGGDDLHAFFQAVLPENGERITAVTPLYDITLVCKETISAIYAGDTASTMTLYQFFPVGCKSPRSMKQFGKDLFLMTERGPAVASGIQEYGDIAPVTISTKVEPLFSVGADWSRIEECVSVYDRRSSRILCFYPNMSGAFDCLVYHTDVSAWSMMSGLDAHGVVAFESTAGEFSCLLGQDDGRIVMLGRNWDDSGEAYLSTYITPFYALGDASTRKRILEARFYCDDNLYRAVVSYMWDNDGVWHEIGNLEDFVPHEGSLWDRGTWDSLQLDGGRTRAAVLRPQGSGYRISFKIESNDASDGFRVLGWTILASGRGRR